VFSSKLFSSLIPSEAIPKEAAMARAQATTDHEVIRHWIETHRGHPSVVRATEGTRAGSAGLLRVDFEPAEDSLEEISWDDFFATFESNSLAFLYQDEKQSRFHKFVSRDSVESESDDYAEENSSPRERSQSARASSGKPAGKTRQASAAEQEEAEEIDEEDLDEEDLEEDQEEEDDDGGTPR
jgi:hypothetical protein